MLVGSTSGDWDGENAGFTDYAAVNIDTDGKEVWRWQASAHKRVDVFFCELMPVAAMSSEQMA